MSTDSPAEGASRHGGLPEQLDAWRMVAARRTFEGALPLSTMPRLRDSLVDTEGDARVEIDFDTDALRVPYIELRITAKLPLECQRSLQRFAYPVRIVQRLGLIRDEADEEALPEGYEALLVGENGLLRPAELVEDELILAVPVVPVAPGTDVVEQDWAAPEEETQRASPFAALSQLKDKQK
ncbi:MAG TPA: YceD family protein [Lysobacter sp.]|nr:YceD family protein [Lysobacter sp.]